MSETVYAQSEGIEETPEAVSKAAPDDSGGGEDAKRLHIIKDELIQLRRQDYSSALKKGQLLTEAKALFGQHGKWLPWLEQVGISQYMAQRFMKVFRVFGNRTLGFDLTYSKALVLTLLPEEDIDGFLQAEHDVGNGERKLVQDMTKRELDKAVHDYLAAKGTSSSESKSSTTEVAETGSAGGFEQHLEAARAAVNSLLSLAISEKDEVARQRQETELRELCKQIIEQIPAADPVLE